MRKVTNFALRLEFSAIGMVCGGKYHPLFPAVAASENFRELPDTTAADAAPPEVPEWMRRLICVQGWFQSDYNLLKRTEIYLPLVRDELKVNTYLCRPPEVFNAKHHNRKSKPGLSHTPPEDFFVTPEEFPGILDRYRKNGFRIIMYTSITNLGHIAEWNKGLYQQQHPEQLQRGTDQSPVRKFGANNLCPNTGALDIAIARAQELVRIHKVDALMFDNNFFQTAANNTPSCYCQACQIKFKEYLLRYYKDHLNQLGVTPDTIAIPVNPGTLMQIWIDWRNRVWAETMERVRKEVPVPIFGNTEYMYRHWVLGVDRLYRHEDAVFSESDSLQVLPEKYVIGNSFAPDRPHFAYLVAYQSAGDRYWLLRTPAQVSELVGTTLMFRVNPWLMFHGWDPEDGYPEKAGNVNAPSQEIIKRYFQFYRSRQDWFLQMQNCADIGVVVSSRNRMMDCGRNFPPLLSKLLRSQFLVEGIHDLTLAKAPLQKYRFIAAENYEMMSRAEADALLAYIRAGGIVCATPEIGGKDQFGRIRPESLLRAGYEAEKDQMKGKLLIFPDADAIRNYLTETSLWKSRCYATVMSGWTLPDGRYLLHIMSQNGIHQRRDLVLPKSLQYATRVKLHSPHLDRPLWRDVQKGVVSLPENLWYCVVECPKKP